MSNLPPLTLLQTIEVAVRLKSFKRAAEEMLVTPSAVSHRVRQVEEHLGQQLFIREGKGLRPTENALTLAKAVAQAEVKISNAWQEVSKDIESRKIRVSCMAAFAEQFILPHLDEFRRKFPLFHLDSTNTTYAEDGNRQSYDILISIGPRPGDDWHCKNLHRLFVKPILSNSQKNVAIRNHTLYGPLLVTAAEVISWTEVAKALDLDTHVSTQTVYFDSIMSMCSAASHGAGIALAPDWIADKLIDSGDVYSLCERALGTEHWYWFASHKDQSIENVHDRFQQWLRSKLVTRYDVNT